MTISTSRPTWMLVLLVCTTLACPGDDGSSEATSTTATSSDPSTSEVGDTTAGVGGCDPSEPILQADGSPTGFVRCSDGSFERTEAVTCTAPTPAGSCVDGSPDSVCTTDADCVANPHGVCVGVTNGPGVTNCSCVYGCSTDADCPGGQICACGGAAAGYPGGTTCIAAACSLSTDCGDQRCHMATTPEGCELSPRMACTTAEDTCRANDDCDFSLSEACTPSLDGPWQCFEQGCA
ncbi:hypothetical protein [Paraliomyxa miuraensis]|uniref:hypothetical protein n=1 Tax=Paraliomyxa miuraensis TaxID=376150 RepID=UPI002253BDE5|nr:hypothetical protein [Paraliomyxa miuraensis]MCX4241152.1 hypothetical protein [Paraliomyxa miuraensis]